MGRPGGAEGPGGCLRRIGEFLRGGGAKSFFRGRNVHRDNFGAAKQPNSAGHSRVPKSEGYLNRRRGGRKGAGKHTQKL